MKKVFFTIATVAVFSLTGAAQSKEVVHESKKDSINADGTVFVNKSSRANEVNKGRLEAGSVENKEKHAETKKGQEGGEIKKTKAKKVAEVKKEGK